METPPKKKVPQVHYIYLGIILLLGIWLNIQMNTIVNLKTDLVGLKKERNEIKRRLIDSRNVLKYLIQKDRLDSLAIIDLQREMAEREKSNTKPRIIYGTKIQQVEKYTPTMVDSFLVDMYPRPGVRKYRYNPDGTLRHYAHTGMESKNDNSAGDPFRLPDE